MIAVLAPGQGAQSPGMFAPWLGLPGAAEQVAEFSEVAGLDLQRLGTTADAEQIKDTAVTQPLIVALGVLAASYLGFGEGLGLDELGLDLGSEDGNSGAVVAAGHSVGELTAAAVAGAFTPATAVGFAARRGAAMADACALTPTGMTALLGGDPDEVAAAIEAAGLTAANRNGAGQIVAAGALSDLAKLSEQPPAGARVRPLPVAGAFHTHYMTPAETTLRDYAASLDITDPRHLLLSNADGTAVAQAAELRARLVAQVTLPVRWDLCLRTVRDLGVNAVLELPPAGTLTGIAKRELPGLTVLALKSPADLDNARRMIESQPQQGHGEHVPDFQVVVAPVKGVFTPADLAEGAQLRRGALLGTVRTNRDEHSVVAGAGGVLVEWLRHTGDIVAAGLPIARLSRGTELP